MLEYVITRFYREQPCNNKGVDRRSTRWATPWWIFASYWGRERSKSARTECNNQIFMTKCNWSGSLKNWTNILWQCKHQHLDGGRFKGVSSVLCISSNVCVVTPSDCCMVLMSCWFSWHAVEVLWMTCWYSFVPAVVPHGCYTGLEGWFSVAFRPVLGQCFTSASVYVYVCTFMFAL